MSNIKMYAEISSKTKTCWGWSELKKCMKKIYHRRFRRLSKQNLLKDNYAADECN